MAIAYIGLLALVAATPVLLFFDNLIVGGTIQFYAAVGMVVVAVGIRPREARHLFKLIRVPVALSAIPLIWMLVQLAPLSIGGLSRSIWETAAGTLGTPVLASISIDRGLSLLALGYYASIVGIAFVAAAVSIERQQAEKLLSVLCGVAVVISLIPLPGLLGGFSYLDESGGASVTIMTGGMIGIILFVAATIMVVERYEVSRDRRDLSSQLLIPIGIRMAGLLVCASTLVGSETTYAIFSVASGLFIVVIVYFVRRIGLGARTALAMACMAVVATAFIIGTKGPPGTGDISLRYMTHTNTDVVSLDNRIIGEVGPGGSGAGTFKAINKLYGTQGSSDALRAPTFAAQIAIELGRPALWIIVGLACAILLTCALGAFNRGRDFFYPLVGAGVGGAMVLNSFSNAGMTNPAISLLVAATLGLALAQSVSRTL